MRDIPPVKASPGAQVRKLLEDTSKHVRIGVAATMAGTDRKTARKYVKAARLPSEMRAPRTWRTHDHAFEKHWPELRAKLELAPELQAKTLLDDLIERYQKIALRLDELRDLLDDQRPVVPPKSPLGRRSVIAAGSGNDCSISSTLTSSFTLTGTVPPSGTIDLAPSLFIATRPSNPPHLNGSAQYQLPSKRLRCWWSNRGERGCASWSK